MHKSIHCVMFVIKLPMLYVYLRNYQRVCFADIISVDYHRNLAISGFNNVMSMLVNMFILVGETQLTLVLRSCITKRLLEIVGSPCAVTGSRHRLDANCPDKYFVDVF